VRYGRCDSAETADLLRSQLQAMVDRPENVARLDEIESRLAAKGLVRRASRRDVDEEVSKIGSDGRSLGRSSGASAASSGSGGETGGGGGGNKGRLTRLHESLAAELREKLGGRSSRTPLLLPSKDYAKDGVKKSSSEGSSSGIGSAEKESAADRRIEDGAAYSSGGEFHFRWEGFFLSSFYIGASCATFICSRPRSPPPARAPRGA